MAHFITHLGTQESAIDKAPQWNTRLLFFCEAALVTITLAVLTLLWWRSAEAARVRKTKTSRDGSQILPSPVPVLPRWLGFLGGHTLLLNISKIAAQLASWAEEFEGDYEIQIFGERVIVLTSVEDIRRVLALRPSKFVRNLSPKVSSWAARQAGLAPSMFLNEGKQWGRSRRLISPNLVGHNLTAMIPCIVKISERFCAKLGGHADSDEVVDAKQHFALFTHDIIAFTACDIDVDSTGSTDDNPSLSFRAIQSAISTANDLQFNAMKIIQWKYLPSLMPWVQRAKKHSCQLGAIVQDSIDTARCSKSENTPASGRDGVVTSTLLRNIITRSSDSAGSDRMKFSDEEILHEVKTLFLAGTDTTSFSLCWAMYYLAKNPVAFARCRNEGLKAAPMSRGMVSTPEQLNQLVFCAAVFREAVRLRPSGPLLAHTCMEDHTTNKGFKIKKGRGVILLLRFASISEKNFTRGAEFIPERWIESERDEALLGKGVECDKKSDLRHMHDAFLGFGSGPRMCPGK
ncbi:unnamed protein product, partial [Ascophyllum nodosum]